MEKYIMETQFEKLIRNKVRFATDRGQISIEDAWDLPLTSKSGVCLDTLAKALNRELKAHEEESFVTASTPANTLTKLKFEAVKYIIAVKLDEAATAQAKLETKAQKEKILGIIAQKQDEQLIGKSLEELTAMVNGL